MSQEIQGIDVSSWQGQIDWSKVKTNGVAFAYIKATEGSSYVNPTFRRNWSEAKRLGIIRGAYHFFDPSVDVSEQIRHFVSVVGQLEEGDLPPVLDLEGDKWKAISQAARVPMVFEWLEGVEDRLKVVPIIYLSPYFSLDVLRTPKHPKLSKYKLWIAHYTAATRPLIPLPWSAYTLWQFTDRATVEGIGGYVDKNRFPGSMAELLALTKSTSLDRGA